MKKPDDVEIKELEPTEYFNHLKSKLTEAELATYEKNKNFVAIEIEKASKMGQVNLMHKSAFIWKTIEKEIVLHAAGLTTYIHREDVLKFIDNVKPVNSVKIVELENFPRSIPDVNTAAITRAMDLKVFDAIIVIYTDLTDEEVITPEQKDFAARNRDPIVLGMFYDDILAVKHDRMYFITDWEDEYCDLTFTKMIDKLSTEQNIQAQRTFFIDHDNVNSLVKKYEEDKKNLETKNKNYNSIVVSSIKKPSLWLRIKRKFLK